MRYRVKSYDAGDRRTFVGVIDAGTLDEVHRAIEARGQVVLSSRRLGWRFGGSRSNRVDLRVFCRELTTLLAAGLNIVEAVEALASRTAQTKGNWIYPPLLQRLREGLSFAAAVDSLPDAFPPLFRAALKGADFTSGIGAALARYLQFDEAVSSLRARLISAAIYPATVIAFGVVVLSFLFGYVVPRFARIYDELPSGIATGSRLILQLGRWVDQHGTLLMALGMVVVGGLAFSWRSGVLQQGFLAIALRVPYAKRRWRDFELARLYRSLALLTGGGYAVLRALQISKDVVLAPELRLAVGSCADAVLQGRSLADTMARADLADEVAVRLIRAGEQSAQLPNALEAIGGVHHAAFMTAVERGARIMEPVLLMLVGSAIGLVVLLMYLPIFDLARSVR